MAETFRVGYTNDFQRPDGTIGWGNIGIDRYAGVPGLEFEFLSPHESPLTPATAGDYDALGVLAPRITAELVDHAPRLALVARFGVGYDSVDLDACTRNGVAVTITPTGVRRPMAAASMTMMLALSHRLLQKDHLTRSGGWPNKLNYNGQGLTGRTLGTIGFGNIARDLHTLAKPWAMRQIAYDPYVTSDAGEALGVEIVDLDTLMRESDFVIVLCMLTPETHHLVNETRLKQMKPNAYLVSMARGPIVDEEALYQALTDGTIQGAGMDVFEQEPPDPNNPIFQLENVIVAPHALCWTDEMALGNGNAVIDSILTIRSGQAPANVVNREVLESDQFKRKLAKYQEFWG